MAPSRKRLHKEIEGENEVKPTAELASLRRVTRSLTRPEIRLTRSRSNSVTRSGSADVAMQPRKKAKKAKKDDAVVGSGSGSRKKVKKAKAEKEDDHVNDHVSEAEDENLESSQGKDDVVVGSFSGSRKKAKKGKVKAESTAEKEDDDGGDDTVNDDGEESSQVKDDVAGSGSGSNTRTIVIEYCKQCSSIKKRAVEVRKGLEKAVSGGFKVLLNPHQPRKGCFEIREDGGETFISHLDMKKPFNAMKDLDVDQVISDIVSKIQS